MTTMPTCPEEWRFLSGFERYREEHISCRLTLHQKVMATSEVCGPRSQAADSATELGMFYLDLVFINRNNLLSHFKYSFFLFHFSLSSFLSLFISLTPPPPPPPKKKKKKKKNHTKKTHTHTHTHISTIFSLFYSLPTPFFLPSLFFPIISFRHPYSMHVPVSRKVRFAIHKTITFVL